MPNGIHRSHEPVLRTVNNYGAVFKPRSFRIAYRFSVERR